MFGISKNESSGYEKEVFAIYDVKTQYYMTPFVQMNRPEALRSFANLLDGDSPIALHPDQFCLFALAMFNVITGEIKPYSSPVSLGLAQQYQSVDKNTPSVVK